MKALLLLLLVGATSAAVDLTYAGHWATGDCVRINGGNTVGSTKSAYRFTTDTASLEMFFYGDSSCSEANRLYSLHYFGMYHIVGNLAKTLYYGTGGASTTQAQIMTFGISKSVIVPNSMAGEMYLNSVTTRGPTPDCPMADRLGLFEHGDAKEIEFFKCPLLGVEEPKYNCSTLHVLSFIDTSVTPNTLYFGASGHACDPDVATAAYFNPNNCDGSQSTCAAVRGYVKENLPAISGVWTQPCQDFKFQNFDVSFSMQYTFSSIQFSREIVLYGNKSCLAENLWATRYAYGQYDLGAPVILAGQTGQHFLGEFTSLSEMIVPGTEANTVVMKSIIARDPECASELRHIASGEFSDVTHVNCAPLNMISHAKCPITYHTVSAPTAGSPRSILMGFSDATVHAMCSPNTPNRMLTFTEESLGGRAVDDVVDFGAAVPANMFSAGDASAYATFFFWRGWSNGWRSNDYTFVNSVVTPTFTITWNGDPDLDPIAGSYQNSVGQQDAIQKFQAAVRQSFEITGFNNFKFYAASSYYSVLKMSISMKNTVTNKEIRNADLIWVLTFYDGLIAELDIHVDSVQFARASCANELACGASSSAIAAVAANVEQFEKYKEPLLGLAATIFVIVVLQFAFIIAITVKSFNRTHQPLLNQPSSHQMENLN